MSGMIRDYDRVRSMDELKALVRRLEASSRPIGMDIETGYRGPFKDKASLDPQRAFIVGISLTDDPSWARYVPIDHGAEFRDPDNLPVEETLELLTKILTEHQLVIHNLRFEKAFFSKVGIDIPTAHVTDTMLLSYVAGTRAKHGLKNLTALLLDEHQMELKDLFQRPDSLTGKVPRRRKDIRFNLLEANDREVIEYACDDAALCLQLLPILEKEIGTDGRRRIRNLEHKVADVVVDMEARGLAVDWDAVHHARAEGEQFLLVLEAELRQHMTAAVGRDCSTLNFNSNPQMQRFVYGTPEEGGLGLTASRYTEGNAPSTDALALSKFEDEVPVFKEFKNYKEAENTLRKISGWIDDFSDAPDRKIHPSYMQSVVPSGRFSANNPNVQQVQKDWAFSTEDKSRTWLGNFRGFVKPEAEHYFLSYDVSQIELRMLAGMSREPTLISAFTTGVDVHIATAAKMLKIPVDRVTKEDRAKGKCLTGDTLVRTRDGLVRLDSLCPERREDQLVSMLSSGVEVWDGTAFQDVVAFYSDGKRPVWRIRTSRGYEVISTADHPWWTPTGWVKTSDVVPDSTWIAMSVGGAPPGPPISVPFSPTGATAEASPRITVSDDWAAVAALADYSRWNGDVKIMPGGTVQYTIAKPQADVAARLRRHFSAIGVTPREVDTMTGDRDLAFASSWFGPAVVALGSDVDTVSSAILASPSSVQTAYLRTLFDIGAKVDRKEIRILLPDGAVRLVQILLAGLGIRTVKEWAAKSAVNDFYTGLDDDSPSGWSYLVVSDLRDLTMFRYIVGSSSHTNRRKLSAWGDDSSVPAYGSWDVVVDVEYIGHRPVFDLTVDVSSRFESNGLIGSNTLNFALLYGMQVKSLGDRLGVTLEEAKALYKLYFKEFTLIDRWVKDRHREGVKNNYVETHFGRRVPIIEYESGDKGIRAKGDRVAVNAPVQGSAADAMKIVMVHAKQVLTERGWWGTKVFLVMNLHDALTFEVSNDIDPVEVRDLLTPVVEMHSFRTTQLRDFPHIEVEWDLGYSWGDSMSWPKDAQVRFEDQQWRVVREVVSDDEGGPYAPDVPSDTGNGGGDGPAATGQESPGGSEPAPDVQRAVPDAAVGGGGGARLDPGAPMGIPKPVVSPEGQTFQMRVAVAEPPPPPEPVVLPPTDTAVIVEIELPDLDAEGTAALKHLLLTNQGPYRCVIIMKGKKNELTIGTSLTEEDRFEIQSRLPGAVIRRTGLDTSLGDDLPW